MSMELFTVMGKLVLDKSGFDSGVREANESGKTFAEKMAQHVEKVQKLLKGTAIVLAAKKAASAVWSLAKETSTAGDRIDKTSQQLGLSRKAFQEWDYILRQNGASIDSMGVAMRTMNAAISSNSAETAAGLSKLGLSAAYLQSLSPEDQFEALVKAFNGMPEGADKSALAIKLFGRSAQSLMPLLNSSADSVEELRQRAHDLGLIMSDEDVDSAVAFGDALDDLSAVWTAVKQKIGAQFLPGFTKGLIAASNALGRITNSLEKAFKEGDWNGFFTTLTDEISAMVPSLIDTVVNIASGLFENADKIVGLAVSIITGLTDGLIRAVPKLVAKLPQIFRSIVDGVKNIFRTLLSTLFGTTEGGGIKWPTWEDVKAGAVRAWNFIKEGLKSVFKFVFGETADGGIKWPTWDDVKAAATNAWNTIKAALRSVFKFVFGETPDGGIKWPTWKDVENAARTAWNAIKEGAKAVFKFIFGETEDGGIKFPDAQTLWRKIGGKIRDLWNGIVGLAKSIFTFMFGQDESGGIKFPSAATIWSKIKEGLNSLWQGVVGFAEGALGLDADVIIKWGQQLDFLDEEGNIKLPDWLKSTLEFIRDAIQVIASVFGFGKKFADYFTPETKEEVDAAMANVNASVVAAHNMGGNVLPTNTETAGQAVGLFGRFLSRPRTSETETPVEQKVDEKTQQFLDLANAANEYSDKTGKLFGAQMEEAADGTKEYQIQINRTINRFSDLDEAIAFLINQLEKRDIAYPHAKGLNYVPYDGYLAELHRGEAVLNANQGRQWRQGNGSGIDSQALYEAVSNAVAAAVGNIAINLDGKSVGNAVTGQVSKNIYQAQLGRRVAAV